MSTLFSRSVTFALFLFPLAAWGDLLEMQNGDRYSGTVISVSSTNVIFQSETQGLIALPREKVSKVNFGKTSSPLVVQGRKPAASETNGTEVIAQLREANAKPESSQVNELLSSAGPEATRQFNDTLKALMTGKLSIGDIRNQARQSAAQIEELKEELGGEVGELLDGYLHILQNFLKESEATGSAKPGAKSSGQTNQVTGAPLKK